MTPHAESRFFPPLARASAEGLLLVGGQLNTAWLRDAYQHGIFPWPVNESLLTWWSPDPRAVLDFDAFHIPHRLRSTLASPRFQVTFDQDFAAVMHGCATAQRRKGMTWITAAMRAAYRQWHAEGVAHSVEVRQDDQLVGGLYGVAIGGMFAAESMFYRVSNASKIALVHLVRHLQSRGYELLDVQQWTPNTGRFGAREISRDEFLHRLAVALEKPCSFLDAPLLPAAPSPPATDALAPRDTASPPRIAPQEH